MKPPIEGMKVRPDGDEILFLGPWIAFVEASCSEPAVIARFEEETGIQLTGMLRGSPINRMIDRSTGREREVFCAFLDWITANYWGEEGKLPEDMSV